MPGSGVLFSLLSEGRKTVAGSPALHVVAPPHLSIFVGLNRAGVAVRHQLNVGPRLALWIALPHRLQNQIVPNPAIARVMRVERVLRILCFGGEKIMKLQADRLKIAVRV